MMTYDRYMMRNNHSLTSGVLYDHLRKSVTAVQESVTGVAGSATAGTESVNPTKISLDLYTSKI